MNIIAIGGGAKTKALTRGLERAETSQVTIIPSACSTEASYRNKVPKCTDFFRKLGILRISVLHDYNEKPTQNKIAHELGIAGLAYVIGGNTPHLMKTLREYQIDQAIKDRVATGIVLSGTSAGALLPFKSGQSLPTANPREETWDYQMLPGLNIVHCAVGVHADKHEPTPTGITPESRFEALLHSGFTEHYAITLDNNSALAIVDDTATIIRSDPNANVRIITNNPIRELRSAIVASDKDMNQLLQEIR